MGILARDARTTCALGALAMAASACYSPDVRDCTIACKSGDDCADGQICGSDHFCAGPDTAGTCSTGSRRDASISATDDSSVAPPVDAAPDAPPDAPTEGTLTITIGGHGTVFVQNVGECEYSAAPCHFIVPLDRDVILSVFPPSDWRFDEWNAGPCNHSESPICVFQPALAITAGAKFRKD